MRSRAVCGLLAFLLVAPSLAHAQSIEDAGDACTDWALNLWGFSYHPDRDIHYNNTNWGAGLRCYANVPHGWFRQPDHPRNHLFVQADAMQDSYFGLLIPLSVAFERRLTPPSADCGVSFIGALTVAYYGNAMDHVSQVKWGPVPQFAFGCGRVTTNAAFIPRPQSQPLAAITFSLTIGLGANYRKT